MVNLHHSEKDIGLKQVTPSLWITIHKFLKVNSITMIKHILLISWKPKKWSHLGYTMLFSYQSIISINILPFFHRFLNNLGDKMLL